MKDQNKNQEVEEKEIIHEVEIQFSEDFLEKNPTIKQMYKDGKWNVPMSSGVDENTAKTITDVIGELKQKDLVTFNPLLEAINQIAEFKKIVGTVKPDRLEDESDKDYDKRVKEWLKGEDESFKDISKTLRSFNGSVTNSKKEIKAPILEAGRKVDVLFNALKGYSDSVKTKSEQNFKPFLDEKKRIEKEKEDLKNKEQTDAIADLANKNEIANQKLLASEAKNSYADTLTGLTNYFLEQEQKIPSLNLSGLQDLLKEINEKVFDFSHITPMEQISLENLEKSLRSGAVLKINTAITNPFALSADEIPQEQPQQVQGTPMNFQFAPDTAPEPVQNIAHVYGQAENGSLDIQMQGGHVVSVASTMENPFPNPPTTDMARFNFMVYSLDKAKELIDGINLDFDEPLLQGVADKLKIQFKTLSGNTKTLLEFAQKKRTQFTQTNNQ